MHTLRSALANNWRTALVLVVAQKDTKSVAASSTAGSRGLESFVEAARDGRIDAFDASHVHILGAGLPLRAAHPTGHQV